MNYHIKRVLGLAIAVGIATLFCPTPSQAAQLFAGQNLDYGQDAPLDNAYLAGNTITVNAPVKNDLTAAGYSVTVKAPVEGDVMVGAGTINLESEVGHSARLAGGTISISGTIHQDLVVFGASITLQPQSVVEGDVIATGSTITLNGTVKGKVIANGNQLTINGAIGSLEGGTIEQLRVGSKAEVLGQLRYTSPHPAEVLTGALIHGATHYSVSPTNNLVKNINTASFFYNMFASLVFCLILLYAVRLLPQTAIQHRQQKPWMSFGLGLATLFFTPVIGVAGLIISAPVGVVILGLYLSFIIISYFNAQLILGEWLLSWWNRRSQQTYRLDWRAAVIGVLITTVLLYIPIIGWCLLGLISILALGSLIRNVWQLHKGALPRTSAEVAPTPEVASPAAVTNKPARKPRAKKPTPTP